VAHETDHQEIEALLLGEGHDRFDFVTGYHMAIKRDFMLNRLGRGLLGDLFEIVVRFAARRQHLADRLSASLHITARSLNRFCNC
jgi:hypothetical protein